MKFRLPAEYSAVRMPPGHRSGITKWRVCRATVVVGVLYRKDGRRDTWGWEPLGGTAQIFTSPEQAAQAITR